MAFRDNNRRESRGGFGRDNRGFGRDRGNRGFGRGREKLPMCDAICDKCKSECQVPFKPTGNRPVLCSNCFEAQGNKHSDSRSRESSSAGGISVAQFKELEAKVDKILFILENLEEDSEDEEDEEE